MPIGMKWKNIKRLILKLWRLQMVRMMGQLKIRNKLFKKVSLSGITIYKFKINNLLSLPTSIVQKTMEPTNGKKDDQAVSTSQQLYWSEVRFELLNHDKLSYQKFIIHSWFGNLKLAYLIILATPKIGIVSVLVFINHLFWTYHGFKIFLVNISI